jgi:Flp pilus assembly protein TadD
VQAKSRRSFWFALVFFALGLLAKPMLVTLPCVMLLLDFWPLQRFSLATFRLSLLSEKTPFFLLTAASCGVTFLAQRAGHAVVPLAMYPLHSRLENVPVAVARYLSKMLWPADLAVVYPPEKFPAAIWGSALAGLLLISILVWRARDRHRCWLVGWLWFLGTLVPVIGLVQVGGTILADRYTYIPAVGIFIAVVFGGYELPRIQRFFPAVAVVLLAGCVLLTEKQLGYWRDSETLFRHTIAITQNNEAAHLNLGSVLDSQGRFGDALDEYHEALRINPNHNLTHFPIGRVLEKMHQPAAALDEYRQCLRLDPDIPAVHNAVGSVLAAQGKYDDAAREFAEAVRLDPHFAIPHIEQAKLFFQQGRDAQAVTELWAAARAEPYDYTTLSIVAHYLAANENAAGRDGANALVLALKADELSDHRQPEISDILGMAFAETGDFTNAMICAQNALEFAPAPQLKDTEPIQRRLALYRNHQPWRESFGATNAPAKN